MAVIQPTPGTALIRTRANLRLGAPDTASPKAGTVEAGVSIAVTGTTTGTSVSGNATWYALAEERFIWSGACTFSAAPPEPDGEEERPDRQVLGDYVPPEIRVAQGIRHTAQGKRPKGLEGLIVHFDAYRIRAAGNGAEDSNRRTLDMLRSGESNGFHYVEISRTGTVFMPEGFDWLEWGYHAGASLCPRTQRTGVSRFYVGVEMNNPGVLYPAQEEGVFCPWYNAQKDEHGNVRLDAQGRCFRKSANDEWFKADEVRLAEGGNIHRHWYLPYSFAQFETLTNLILWLRFRYPDTFRIEQVFGHDEVAPHRKDDPGGALATPDEVMTMDRFRTFLLERSAKGG